MSISRFISRRHFLAGTGALLGGLALKAEGAGFLATEPIIDIHQHTNYSGRTQEEMHAHQRAMGVSMTILLPGGRSLNYGSTHYGVSNGLQVKAGGNEICYQYARQHQDEFTFGVSEVPDFPGAIPELEKYLKLGAKVIGELKFNVESDSPEMRKIYELAQAYEVPVLMHWQYNMYNRGFDRFHKMLRKYPKVNFIGHAQTFWANIDKKHLDQNELYPKGKVTEGGWTDRLLSDYPNMWADMSAGSGLNSMTRDEDHAREFLKRHQDKLLYGSDCNDKAGTGTACQGAGTIAAIRRLSASKEIERKLLYDNARRLFRL
jgi:predicted TIM-barrel fold metal-dependent hydrolase